MPEVQITNNSGSIEIVTDPEGGELGTIDPSETKTLDLDSDEFSRAKTQINKLVNDANFDVTLPDTLDDHDDVGLPDEYDLRAAGKGGLFRGDDILSVDPTHPYAADDADGRTPFVTIQAALDWIGTPDTQAEQDKDLSVLIAHGVYNETLNVPSHRDITLMAMGEVEVDAVNVDVDPSVDQGGSTTTLTMKSQTSVADGGLFGRGWLVSADLTMTAQSSGASAIVYLEDVSTGFVATDSNLETSARFHNTFVGTCNAPEAILTEAHGTFFNSAVTVKTYQHISNCEFGSDMTISEFTFSGSGTKPIGMYDTYFAGQFSAPTANSLVLDAVTNWYFNNNGGTLAGSATKNLIHDNTV